MCLTGALVWNSYQAYTLERKRVLEEVDILVNEAAQSVQAANITLLNNSVRMLTDKEIHEKIAFAAGVTRNEGKLSVRFGEDEDKEEAKEETGNKPLNVNRDYLIQNNLKFDSRQLKGVPVFDSILKAQLMERKLMLNYVIHQVVIKEELDTQYNYSETFILDFFDPVMYKVKFKLPVGVVLMGIIPNIVSGIFILVLLVGAFIFFYRSYRLQMQMASFKESLFSNVTHELKSPLTSLRLIIDEATEGEPLSPRHSMFARKELNRMSLLVEKILSFGKMTHEQIELNKDLLDVADVVNEAIDVQSMVIGRLGATVKVEADNGSEVYADKALLTNVIITILDNSLKYNDGTPEINIQVHSELQNIVVAISDNGVGIMPGFHKRIFEPFFRVPDFDRHDVKGHGLGLSFVKQVIEMHGGEVYVKSARGEGATFFIKLPKA